MNIVTLKKKEVLYLDDRFFIVKSGKVLTKVIFENGAVVTNEICYKQDDILGNFFLLVEKGRFSPLELQIEAIALENDVILEQIDIKKEDLVSFDLGFKIINNLLQRVFIKFFYHLYDTKGYILSLLKLYQNKSGTINKNELNYKNFNMSKSQFYLTMNNLKSEHYITKVGDIILLNSRKIDLYLTTFFNS